MHLDPETLLMMRESSSPSADSYDRKAQKMYIRTPLCIQQVKENGSVWNDCIVQLRRSEDLTTMCPNKHKQRNPRVFRQARDCMICSA